MVARVDVLVEGYADERVASTVTLLRDGDTVVVVDPGMVVSRSAILDPLAALGVNPAEVTDVVLSHHHPDHTINIALFEHAQVHDVGTTYVRDEWIDREPGDWQLSESITLTPTPGHTAEDLSVLITTESGLVVTTHLWWMAEGPADDPFAPDRGLLREQRQRILDLGPALILPGHGAGFAPSSVTPI